MLRIDEAEKKLVRLAESTLAEGEHWERQLQSMICASPEAFCKELGEKLCIIGQEVQPSDAVSDRIDILALDEDGNAVVIELKRGTNKLQLLQAVSYAGMVSRWEANNFIETLAANFNRSNEEARTAIEDHAGPDISSVNHAQRILLIAEDYDPALLVAAERLHESYDVDIRCFRLQLSKEKGTDYMTCTCIYPPIEIAGLTRGPGKTGPAWVDWDSALEAVENVAERNFVRAELARHQESRLSYRQVIYRMGGKRRFYLGCRKKYAYVLQWGRFEEDEAYWRKALSEPEQVQKIADKRGLRFHLTTPDDFAAFGKAMQSELTKVDFTEAPETDEPSDGDLSARNAEVGDP